MMAVLSAASSCKAWLSVESEDRILEEKMFSTTDGFYTALNGVYIDLVSKDLYSGTFGPTTPDILAQYWNTEADSHLSGSLALFQNEAKKTAVNSCWTRAYALILNLNKIIGHCDNGVLPTLDYNIIKGEATALRALLHFELLRYFGPAYKVASGAAAIPYMTSADPKVGEVLSVQKVLAMVNADIEEALALLEQSDPVVKYGKNESGQGPVSSRNIYSYRNLRMNLYAVKALGARVNMYMSSLSSYRAKALSYAEAVIADAAQWFPFTTREEANGVTIGVKDRILSSDILFAVYNTKRGADIYEQNFSNTLQVNRLLAMTPNGYKAMLPYESDLRTVQWASRKDVAGNDVMCLVKYEAVEADGFNFPYMIPVLRMSEMYLIAAECYALDGKEDLAYERLNSLRNARQIPSASSALMAEIEKEYIREFAGEGQYFWYCKRNNFTALTCLYDRTRPDKSVSADTYLFALPQAEEGYRDGTN